MWMAGREVLDSPELIYQALVSKSRGARRTIVCHEALSKPLGLKALISVARVLSTWTEFENAELDFVLANDSVCSALIYKHGLDIKNVLIKNSVETTVNAAMDLVDLFPKCTVIFTWIPGKINCADPLTKFLPDPIGICNSDEWRSGYPFMRTVKSNRANTYLTVSSSGVKYLGIPDEITKTEKNTQ